MSFKRASIISFMTAFSLCCFISCTTSPDTHDHDHDLDPINSEDIPESILGLKAESETHTIQLISADPDPAIKGKNDWTLSLTDKADNAITGATIVAVPFMIVHGHGSSPLSYTASESEQEGEYLFTAINFIMVGTWEITFKVTVENETDAGAASNEIVLTLKVVN